MENLIVFGKEFSSSWTTLPKEKILNKILDSILETRWTYKENIKDLRNDFGVYVFFIRPKSFYKDYVHFRKDWEIDSFKKYPKVVKKRFLKSVSTDGWFPFYVGKGEQLKKRVEEHISHHSQHSTYGLKLKERESFLLQNEIEVGYWHLPQMEDVLPEIKQFIITNFESALREKLNPWVGKQ